MKIFNGIFIIVISTFLSFIIANLPTGSDPGLGGFILLLWPPILGILGIVFFLIICANTKSKRIRISTSILLGIYLVYVGLGLYIGQDWPLIYW